MSSWVFEVGICLTLVIMAFALFQSYRSVLRRLGGFILMGATGLGFWFWTRSVGTALFGISLWVIFPIIQAGWMSRRVRFSIRRRLEPGALNAEDFSELQE